MSLSLHLFKFQTVQEEQKPFLAIVPGGADGPCIRRQALV